MVPVTQTPHRISHWSFFTSTLTCSHNDWRCTTCCTRSRVVKKQNRNSSTPMPAITAMANW